MRLNILQNSVRKMPSNKNLNVTKCTIREHRKKGVSLY